ncbi:MAG: alanine--tRNA ligase [Bacteroidota bacterium]
MMTANEIRQAFLDFFQSKGHQVVPSAPIVIKNDPTLLFTNAGMNQFKDYFLGNKPAPFKRVVDTQKCLRVSGKHNDLEEVGVDTYHHTMFEMLGNWSFGDYFKNEAIEWSWELLTEIYQIPKDRLYATVFEGDEKEKLPPSKIALAKWKELLPLDHIVMGNKKDNFWEMGDTGPCGPCSEIHVDCRSEEERKKIPGHELVNKDHPQVIEIWNNVFIQFNRKKDGSLEPLPSTHVDTGMGLERLVRVLQNKNSNYDTDIFSGTIAATEKLTARKYNGSDDKTAVAFRVIADHIRAIGFTIADGQLPSNTGAGYVIRRILRRAVRYYYSYLDHKSPLLYQLIPVLAEQFQHVFPELAQQAEFVSKVVREEEDAFLRTLDKGLKRIEEMVLNSKGKTIDGKAAFELYDTYGFPIDLTRLIASEKNLQVDEPGFEKEMLEQKNRSRAATAIDAGDWTILKEDPAVRFMGYEQLDITATITRYRNVRSKGKESFQIVLDQTPFYAESGGQVGDTGTLTVGGETILVTDTKKENDLIIHFCEQLPKSPQGPVTAEVNKERRQSITLHHSATHLLHAALRRVLGSHVVQKGSLVQEGNFRFDFSHFAKVTADELAAIESLVNEKIRQNIPVVIRELPREEALKLGAMALFGEKYGDRVRVVTIDPDYSIELCGGTHAGHTGMLGFFKITTETAVAAGVRRIEAVAGTAASNYIQEQLAVLEQVKDVFKNPKELVRSIENQLTETADMRKKIEQLEQRLSMLLVEELITRPEAIGPVNYIARRVDVPGPEVLKKVCHDLKEKIKNHLAVLVASIDGKTYVAVGIAEELVKSHQLDAGKIIKEHVAPLIKGGGGGQKILATAGGQDSSRIEDIFQVVKKLL